MAIAKTVPLKPPLDPPKNKNKINSHRFYSLHPHLLSHTSGALPTRHLRGAVRRPLTTAAASLVLLLFHG